MLHMIRQSELPKYETVIRELTPRIEMVTQPLFKFGMQHGALVTGQHNCFFKFGMRHGT